MPPTKNSIKFYTDSPEYKNTCLETFKSLFCLNPSLRHYSNDIEKLIDDSTSDNLSILSLESYKDEKNNFNSSELLKVLRKLMKKFSVSTYIVPSEDAHQSEYTASNDQRRSYISGFTGSAGIAIITLHEAALSTDSRYFIQAEKQLDNNWTLLKQGVAGVPNWIEWCFEQTLHEKDQLNESGIIAVDPRLISANVGLSLLQKCHSMNLNFVTDLEYNLIDKVKKIIGDKDNNKNKDREKNKNSIFVYDIKFAGESALKKIKRVRKMLDNDNCFAYVASMLDSIAYLLNLRGNDIDFNPVFFSYLVITSENVVLYVDKNKLSKKVTSYLNDEFGSELIISSYNQIWNDLPALTNKLNKENNKICLDSNANYSIFNSVPSIYEINFRSVGTEIKGIKNKIEQKNNKLAQVYDSVALVRFFGWLDEQKQLGSELSELDICRKTFEYRSQMPNFKGLSFSTIAASGSNSAIVHYEPTPDDFSKVDMNSILLLDSGAQYLEGTTDITRTVHLGTPTEKQRKAYSLVLAGHLNVAMLKFKQGFSSYSIDALARLPLKRFGWDYGHGTGHGIDNYICVHAGPCGLSPMQTGYNYKPLEAGNFISDEPGVYLEGEWGIRIESDISVVADVDDDDDDHKNYNKDNANSNANANANVNDNLMFDYLSMVPFCRNLIDIQYLKGDQIEWVNAFHEKVVVTLTPWLEQIGDQRALLWLRKATETLY